MVSISFVERERTTRYHKHFIIDVVTKEENVVSNKAIVTDFIAPCVQEEADTRMFLHATHAGIGGSK